MDELIKTFHIDWKLLIAQIVNFGIVLTVLWAFALKPLMRVMNKRTQDIEKSLQDAKEVERKLREAEKTKEEMVLEAKRQSQAILETTSQEAEKMREEKLQATRQELEKITRKAKADLQQEKDKMVREAKEEVGSLIITASSKIIGKNLDTETNKKLIEETVRETK